MSASPAAAESASDLLGGTGVVPLVRLHPAPKLIVYPTLHVNSDGLSWHWAEASCEHLFLRLLTGQQDALERHDELHLACARNQRSVLTETR